MKIKQSPLTGLSLSPKVLNAALWILVLLPPAFIFVMIQYSAITYPFWDHCALIKFFVKFYDGHLTLADLWSPHNHTRPFTYRTVMLFNGILTDWDIRSEYVYLFASFYSGFLILAYLLWSAAGRRIDTLFLCFLLVLSIFHFSPAGHHNHYWSMMCQLTFTHFFVTLTLALVAFDPLRWRNNILAAVSCWLAVYTLTNGLVALIAAALIVQFSHPEPRRINRFTLFWAINLLVILPMYLPGLPESPGKVPIASPLTLLWFCLIYLGSPLLYLVNLSLKSSAFPKPQWNGVFGILLLSFTGWACAKFRKPLLEKSLAARLFVGFTLFAIGSALATSVGRAAFDVHGVTNADASRYTIFGSYFVYGLLFFFASLARQHQIQRAATPSLPAWPSPRFATAALALLVLLSLRTYHDSLSIYRGVYKQNRDLAAAYYSDKATPEMELSIYPSVEAVRQMKADLRRLRIGPYRNLPVPAPTSNAKLVTESE